MARVAMLSMHTSPLAQPGTGDGGGMNVYVHALAGALARAGVGCDVITRADRPGLEPVVDVEPGYRVVHVSVGPPEPLARADLADLAEPLADAVIGLELPHPVLHAHYWMSGAIAHALKHALDRSLAMTFHTLALVKASHGVQGDLELRAKVEREVVGCADLILASTGDERDALERAYGADPARVEVVAPGVDHELFEPSTIEGRAGARARLGLADRRVLLFVGRIQPLKGADVAIGCLAELDDPEALLVVVGGPSGEDGVAELTRLHDRARDLNVIERVRFVPPQPHDRLPDYYRAADVCLVPSRTESFGLVALEAAACGTPVVAADVGGLRSIVADGRSGFLVAGRDPADYAARVRELLGDPGLAAIMGAQAHARSRRYAWSMTAARLRRLYADLTAREPVSCR